MAIDDRLPGNAHRRIGSGRLDGFTGQLLFRFRQHGTHLMASQ
ncbi:MAG: hypothetical protein ACYCZD_12360 [Rhodanobacter sp.]